MNIKYSRKYRKRVQVEIVSIAEYFMKTDGGIGSVPN